MYGPHTRAYSVSLASNTTQTSALSLGGHSWEKIYLQIPTHASGGTKFIRVSDSSDGTYYRLHVYDPATGAPNLWQVSEASSVTGGHYELPGGLTYLKIETAETVTDAATTFKVIVS